MRGSDRADNHDTRRNDDASPVSFSFVQIDGHALRVSLRFSRLGTPSLPPYYYYYDDDDDDYRRLLPRCVCPIVAISFAQLASRTPSSRRTYSAVIARPDFDEHLPQRGPFARSSLRFSPRKSSEHQPKQCFNNGGRLHSKLAVRRPDTWRWRRDLRFRFRESRRNARKTQRERPRVSRSPCPLASRVEKYFVVDQFLSYTFILERCVNYESF